MRDAGVDVRPAATRAATVCAPFGKWPGQSAAMCNSVRPTPRRSTNHGGSKLHIVAEMSPQCLHIPTLDRRLERDGSGIIGLNAQHRSSKRKLVGEFRHVRKPKRGTRMHAEDCRRSTRIPPHSKMSADRNEPVR